MKVILLKNMERLGKAGDMVDVAPGYGRNYLIPQGYADILTLKGKKQVELNKKLVGKRADSEFLAAKELADRIEGNLFEVKARVGARGKLYGSITTQAVADSIQKSTGVKIDKRNLTLLEPVKMLGSYNASLKLHPDMLVNLRINVTAAVGSKAGAKS